MPELVSTKIDLSAAERAQIRAAAAADAAEFAPRLDDAVDALRLEQPYFPGHRIVELTSAVPMPSRRLHVATGPVGVKVLTGHAEHLHAMCDAEPLKVGLAPRAAAQAYAKTVYHWVNDAPLGELVVSDFDEIPWYGYLTEPMKERIAKLRKMYAFRMEPETQLLTNVGWELRFWVVAMKQLIDRRVHLPYSGKLFIVDEVAETDIPVPPGNRWGFKGERLVPVG